MEPWPSPQERHADHSGSLWSFSRSYPPRSRRSRSYPPRSRRSRATHLGTSTPTLITTTSPSCSIKTRLSLVQRSSPSLKPPQAKTNGVLLQMSHVACYDAHPLSTAHLHNKHTPEGSTPMAVTSSTLPTGLWTARPDSALSVNTAPHLHCPAHVNFSRVPQGRAKAQDKHCVSSTSHSSHLARHVSRAVNNVSLFDVTCTFHSFSSSSST